MPDSEILKTFDEKRGELKPYGLTCETWRPQLMPKIDRHNEIELNYIPEGSITYFFPTGKVTVPPHKMALFWGLIPHKICLLYTSPSPRDSTSSRMPSSA